MQKRPLHFSPADLHCILLHVCTGREHRTHHHLANTTWRHCYHHFQHCHHSRFEPLIGFSHIFLFFMIILYPCLSYMRFLYQDVSFIKTTTTSNSEIVSRNYIRARKCPRFIVDLSVQDRAESDEFIDGGGGGDGGGSGGSGGGDCERRRSRMH